MFNKYKERGAYHYEWYKTNKFDYKDCVDKCVEFCRGSTLDVGCGDGVVTRLIQDKGYEAIGIDDDHEGVMLALSHGSNVSETSLYEPLKGKWEYMVCLNVIEHLEHPEAIKRIFNHNITKAAIIITDIPQGDLPPEHVHEFTPGELIALFGEFNTTSFNVGKDFHGIKVYK